MKFRVCVRRQGTGPTEWYAKKCLSGDEHGRFFLRLEDAKDGVGTSRPVVLLYPGLDDIVIIEEVR